MSGLPDAGPPHTLFLALSNFDFSETTATLTTKIALLGKFYRYLHDSFFFGFTKPRCLRNRLVLNNIATRGGGVLYHVHLQYLPTPAVSIRRDDNQKYRVLFNTQPIRRSRHQVVSTTILY